MFRGLIDRQAGTFAGASSPTAFQHQAGRSLDLIHRLQLDRKLDNHDGCVNTVAFTPTAEHLVSGSDDLYINVWDWQLGIYLFAHKLIKPRQMSSTVVQAGLHFDSILDTATMSFKHELCLNLQTRPLSPAQLMDR